MLCLRVTRIVSRTIDSAVTIEAIFEAEGIVFQFGRTRGTVRATGATFDVPEVQMDDPRGTRS